VEHPQQASTEHIQQRQQQLGQRIRQLREARGWSQDTFAHLAGLNRAYPHKIERAKVDLRFSTLLRIAAVFELSVDQLLKLD
jgi:transcriptional regulator with XRE-family HTH domain